ncbi:unnamed protein product, partial [Amoebophrya sp. A25]|eukprot:GSA25T00027283001.1
MARPLLNPDERFQAPDEFPHIYLDEESQVLRRKNETGIHRSPEEFISVNADTTSTTGPGGGVFNLAGGDPGR